MPRGKKRTRRRRSRRRFRRKKKPSQISDLASINSKKINLIKVLTPRDTNPYDSPNYGCTNIVSRITDVTGMANVLIKYYMWYRIAGVKITIWNKSVAKNQPIMALDTSLNPTGGVVFGQDSPTVAYLNATTEFLIVQNREGLALGTTLDEDTWMRLKETKGSRHILQIKPQRRVSHKYKPNVLGLTYEGITQTAYTPKYNMWIRNDDLAAPHYGVSILTKNNSYYPETYEIDIEYCVQYKTKTDDPKFSIELGQPLTHPAGADCLAGTLDNGVSVDTADDDYVVIIPDHDDDTDKPNQNGYEELDLTVTG